MPLIDLLCHYGVTDTTLAVRPPELSQAKAYADQFGVEMLAFVSREAAADIHGGNAKLAQALAMDARFKGWLTLSVHQSEASQELARQYLTRNLWLGARFEQVSDADALTIASGREVLNALRRYGRPILVTATSPVTLHAVVEAAKEFHSLRFVLNPQSETLSTDAVAAIKQTLNISLLPSAACAERDLISSAFAHLGDRRVLWGSDWGRRHPAAALGMIKDSAISGLQRERVGYRNARELLGAAPA
jgi:predicted TIM-barrel fold metal-dependent hydrolase